MKERRDLVVGWLRKAQSDLVPLTPFAVELRYDADFWPSEQDTHDARALALDVWHFVLPRLPEEVVDDLNSASGN